MGASQRAIKSDSLCYIQTRYCPVYVLYRSMIETDRNWLKYRNRVLMFIKTKPTFKHTSQPARTAESTSKPTNKSK